MVKMSEQWEMCKECACYVCTRDIMVLGFLDCTGCDRICNPNCRLAEDHNIYSDEPCPYKGQGK